METTIVYWGYIRIMEKKMETTIVYWGYIRIMEKKMETTVLLRWTPHPVIVITRDNRDYIRVRLYSSYTTTTGWGVLLRYCRNRVVHVGINLRRSPKP